MYVHLQYHAMPIAATSTNIIRGDRIGGFLCITSGTVTLTRNDGTVLINAFPVTAGQWYFMPFHVGQHGGTFTTAGGASGTLAV